MTATPMHARHERVAGARSQSGPGGRAMRLRQRAIRLLTAAALALPAVRAASAAGVFVEDIQVSKRGDEATIAISLACPMRFRSDMSTQAGALLEIRVAPLDTCRQFGVGEGVASEVYRPESGRLAHLTELEYESLGLGDNLLIFHFDRPVDYRVAQRGDLRTIELRVRVGDDAAPQAAPAPAAPPPAQPPPRTAPPAATPSDRAPITSRVRVPSVTPDYVINLQSTRDPVDMSLVAGVKLGPGQHLYVSTTTIAGVTWYRLRIGFFAGEGEANAVLAGLAASFPRAWIGRAEADEVQKAASLAVERGGVVAESPQREAAAAGTPAAGAALAPERVEELRAEARKALIAGDYATAIRDYTRLTEAPGDHRAEARENLGIAREKSGQTAYAITEYRRFLEEFPQSDAVPRVRQRLSNLVAVTAQQRLRSEETEARRFEITTGLSQYYYRNVDRADQDQPELTTFSGLLTDLDLTVRHRGDSVNMLGRLTINDLHDMLGQGQGSVGDLQRIAYAYYDVADAQNDWSVRVGRQALHNWGVLGRFDGVHGTYQWTDDRRLHVMLGYPVETTLDGVKTGRQFVGAAVDFDRLVGNWGFSPYVQSQKVDGIADRQAVGVEARYVDETRTLTTMLDYDTLYGEINTALAFGTWRLRDRITLTGLYDERTSIFTRNALIGQPVSTFDDLLRSWTEDELRQLARDRTATSKTASIGMTMPLGERLQLNADVTTLEIGPSVDSAGVAAVPGTGRQVYYSGTLVASALFGQSDVNLLNLRYGEAPDFTTTLLTWDTRVPIGKRLRINPRLRLGVWESTATGIRRETVTPGLRLLWSAPRRYRFELEVGQENLVRTSVLDELRSTGKYLTVGYTADFGR
ncbi:MAG TPA: SPOR domain-containing protein [Gammaproteobacteria bacterium]|nr:SPOR domain-containing protein [Gammaproteobacteria bacterium]